MTKDGLGDKIAAILKRAYDRVLDEPVPEDIKALLARL